MALGRRKGERQEDLWVAAHRVPSSSGHPFYDALNRLLKSIDFDRELEARCEELYRDGGRPSIPPGVYFRMLLVGYFEGLGSQREIAWRCGDSLSLRRFLGLGLTDHAPDHSSLTRIRQRIPAEIDEWVHREVLAIAATKKLIGGRTVAVDSTMIAANAAMKSMVRRGDGSDWPTYVGKLADDAGVEIKSKDDLRRFDRKRRGKRVSNDDWTSPTDPDSKIARMKDGTTKFAYKVQHTVDLEDGIVLDATVHDAETADSALLEDGIVSAQVNLDEAETEIEIKEAVADKGYHKAEVLADVAELGVRTYIPQPRSAYKRRWLKKPESHRDAYHANRRRTSGRRGRALQRKRSEYVERSIAHSCGTGGFRRTTLRGRENVQRRAGLQAVAMNLGTILRRMLGAGTPKGLADLAKRLRADFLGVTSALRTVLRSVIARTSLWSGIANRLLAARGYQLRLARIRSMRSSSTGC